jgi:hypothetical protein
MCVARLDLSQRIAERTSTDAEGWARCERLNKIEAERLLEWLEANDYSQREVSLDEDGTFTVRWRREAK